jgi:hypothetical protein
MDQDQIKKTDVYYLGQASKFCRTECDSSAVLPSAIHERTFFMGIFLGIAPCLFDKSDIKKMNGINPYSDDSNTGNWITRRKLVPIQLCFHHSVSAVQGNNHCLLYK